MNSEQQNQMPQQQLPPATEPTSVPAQVPKTFRRYSTKPAKDFFDKFREDKLCTIPATSPVQKEDMFLAMRPKQGTCLDYRISETDTKLDAGMTRIHIRQVNATYEPLPPKEPESEIPPPPKKRKRNPFHNKYCHAGTPVFDFAEDIYARRVDRAQEFYKGRMVERIARIKQELKCKKSMEHDYMLQLCGPDWFIELSPIQKEAIDNLKDAIARDLRFGEIGETSYILGRLGIFLRPNHRCVEIALSNCCKCPVEFLLTLYQLMKPNRTSYSLNDMLILSSVVHLTLRSTLKEMHIRLPSPPPPSERKPPKPVRPKKCIYKSPYLKPVLFVRSKPTALEDWQNRHLTFPKNPYFTYLKDLYELRNPNFAMRSRQRLSKEKSIASPHELTTLQNELLAAQAAFVKMHAYYEHENVKLLRASTYHSCDKQVAAALSAPPADTTTGEYNEAEDTSAGAESSLVTAERTTVSLAVEVNVTEEYDNDNKRTMTVYQCQVDTSVDQDTKEDCGPECEYEPVDEEEKAEEEESCICKIAERRFSQKHQGDTATIEDGQPKSRFKDDIDEAGRKLIEVKERRPSNCTCRDIIEKRIEETTCQCTKCKEDMERKNLKTTFVIEGTQQDSEGPVPIISAVKAEKRCTCLERYLKRVNKVDHQKEIRRANEHLMDMDQPFVVTGVAIGPDGKTVYNLSAGVAVNAKCRCCKERPQPSDTNKLATMPLGRQKYVISGVHATPQGNVFVISGAVPIEPCGCMQLYNEFVQQHDPCMQLYGSFLEKIKCDTEEYMEDLRNRNVLDDDDESSGTSTSQTAIEDQEIKVPPYPETEDESVFSVDGSADENCDESRFSLDVEFQKVTPRTGRKVCICKDSEERDTSEQEERYDLAAYEPTDYERYIILRYIPIDTPAQTDIIKRLLNKLAEDNFPLAKLPDCHKLPIFKIWMAKRTYMYWTYEDRLSTLALSKVYWNHVFHCQAYRTKNITLGISHTRENDFTWLDAKMVKDFTSKRRFDYQRQQRRASVAAAREFFPTLFMYENHTARFRDVFFAYMPSKEEDVLFHNVWKAHEYKNLLKCRQIAKHFRCSKLA